MVLLETIDSAAGVAAAVTEQVPDNFSQTQRRLYKALVWTAVETARARGHTPSTTQVVMHLPLEQLALSCGLDRVTVWRNLPVLKAVGLIDYQTHKGTCRGETRNTGTVWRVRLTPNHGCKVRLNRDDLKHKWRDLDGDVRRGRTSYKALKEGLQHTKAFPSNEISILVLTKWTLPRKTDSKPVTSVCCKLPKAGLETVLDLKEAPVDGRNQMVTLAAEALATALNDRDGEDFYRRLLWQLLRASKRTAADHFYTVYLAAARAQTDSAEGFARKPGALFVSRLKAAPWWEEVMNGPPIRIGTAPLEA